MPSPIPHHLASGIHPGAFVQPTEPSTADVQDGVLWLDTSTGPPHQLKRWHADASAWHPVQMDATGYPLPLGNRVEERVVPGSSIPDPTEAPSVEIETVISGLPAGTYRFAYTFVDAEGHETLLSPITAVTSTSPAFFAIFRPTLPDGVFDINVYLIPPSPSSDIATGFVVNFGGEGTIPPYAITGTTPESFPGTPQPPEANTTGTRNVVVVDPLGAVGLQVPLATLTEIPASLVGKDPSTGIPAYCPQSTPRALVATEQQDIERPNPEGDLTCTQIVCGVATALRDELYSTYSTVRSIINSGISTLGSALGDRIVDAGTLFFVALTDGLDIELAVPIKNALKLVIKAVPGITGNVLQAGFADLNSDQKEWLRQTCWCALLCEDNQVTLTQQMLQDWQTVVANDTVMLSGIQRDALAALIQYGGGVGLSNWAQIAQTGAGFPFHDCDAYVCP